MRFSVLILLSVLLLTACSTEDQPLTIDYPQTFVFDQAVTTGMRTYYYTDSIIYRVDNLQDLDSMSVMLDANVTEAILQDGPNSDEFVIKEITFESETMAAISYYNAGATTVSTQNASYILEQNIGSFDAPFLFNFKVNEDLTNLLSCYSHIATRTVDTLFLDTDQLLPGLDTMEEDNIKFQLIPTDGEFIEGYCNPTNESIEMELYSTEQSVQNNERIIIHRMDLLFKPN